ncbi:hypothetical protein DRE_02802 [Drechslerella stenobrocha 248]|uniref:Uncharacterized protein n=1 Tax=Drechslerella stenobrocha 248 TaxID=1043628 RepID=W7IFI4_9PEZI|nr:hypothetical protein DRE_02802 [Drechslerella stenobrocha 248]
MEPNAETNVEPGQSRELGLPPEKDPTSPNYVFAPEHPRLENISPASITTPTLTPRLPVVIGGFTGPVGPNDVFFIRAMRARGQSIGRPFTPVELAVLSRYTRNIQTGVEWVGLFGMAASAYWGFRSGLWPFEGMWRQAFGNKSAQPQSQGPIQPMGPGNNPVSASSTEPSAPIKPFSRAEFNAMKEEIKTELKSELWRTFKSNDVPGEVRRVLVLHQAYLDTFPEHRRRGISYRLNIGFYNIMDRFDKQICDNENAVQQAIRRQQPTYEPIIKIPISELSVEEQRKIMEKCFPATYRGAERMREVRAKIAELSSNQSGTPQPPGSQGEAERPKVGARPGASGVSSLSWREAFRLGTWAYVGKHLFVIFGVGVLAMRSRRLEEKDEQLQEFNHDRKNYARARFEEEMSRSRQRLPDQTGMPPHLPPRSAPPPTSQYPPTRGGGSTQDQDDSQSLGGLQPEAIDWGDFGKQEEATDAPSVRPPPPTESAWVRARRGEQSQQPTMEQDQWAPRSQDPVPSAANTDNISAWDRIRQQASEGYGGERRMSGETKDAGDRYAGPRDARGKEPKQKSREQAQKDFDAQLEKERRGEPDSW